MLVHLLIEETHSKKLVKTISVVSMSLDHHQEDLALKSPVITDKNGLHLFMSLKSFSKLDKNNQINYYFG